MLDQTRTVDEPAPIYTPSRSACKQPGCTCKDARIFSARKAAFARFLAEQRGQTVDRVIEAEPLSAVLLRSNEPEVVESKTAPNTCACPECGGQCESLLTISRTARCRECAFGQHVR